MPTLEEIYYDICNTVGKDPDSGENGHCPAHDDKTGSLSVGWSSDRSKILLKCFAGCLFSDITRELGYDESDLFREADRPGGDPHTPPLSKKKNSSKNIKKKKVFRPGCMTVERIAELKKLPVDFLLKLGLSNGGGKSGLWINIDYKDAAGRSMGLGRRRMYERAKDGMFWKTGARPRDRGALYGLQFMRRIAELGWVILVEGETDCWTLWHHRYPALGIPGVELVEALKAEHVREIKQIYLFVEPTSKPGTGGDVFEKKIPLRLSEIGYKGEIYKLTLDGFKDPSDLHVKGGEDEFKRVFEAALTLARSRTIKSPPPKDVNDPTPEFGKALTDLGAAERMWLLYGDIVRWCETWKEFLIWDGRRWKIDEECRIVQLAIRTARSIYQEMVNANGNRDDIFKYAKRSEHKDRLKAMGELLKALDGIAVLPKVWDAHPMLLAVNNGTVDLTTGKLQPTRKDYFGTRLCPVDFDSSAQCPIWERFLDDIMDGDRKMLAFLRRAAGYSLTGSCEERCFFLLWGKGKNGKSTFVETLQELLGDYALRTPTGTLMAQKNAPSGSQASPDLARLQGARFVAAAESEAGQRLSESVIKDLTGQDTITARHLFSKLFDFTPEFKLWLSTNHKPIIRDNGDAIWDRVKLIPFQVRFVCGTEKNGQMQGDVSYREIDKSLKTKILAELPGILQWAVRGCLEWQQEGLMFPEKVEEAIAEYRGEMDVLKDFVEECCYVAPGCSVTASELYTAYRRWCENGSLRVIATKMFKERMTEKGFEYKRTKQVRKYNGIRLLTDDETQSEDYYDFGQGDRVTGGDSNSHELDMFSSHKESYKENPSPPVTLSPAEQKPIGLDQFRKD